jgi:hypothetical protein
MEKFLAGSLLVVLAVAGVRLGLVPYVTRAATVDALSITSPCIKSAGPRVLVIGKYLYFCNDGKWD